MLEGRTEYWEERECKLRERVALCHRMAQTPSDLLN